jgi:hypothetical protein
MTIRKKSMNDLKEDLIIVKVIIYSLAAIVALFAIYILLMIFLPYQILYSDDIKKGNKIVNELDIYYNINNKYPEENDWETLNNIYIKAFLDDNLKLESTRPYYYRAGNEYFLIYHLGFDPPDLLYCSKTKEWVYGNTGRDGNCNHWMTPGERIIYIIKWYLPKTKEEFTMKNKNIYSDFWKWFEENTPLIFNFEKDQERIFDLLQGELHKIDENLVFEFGPIIENKREFIISADGIKDSFNSVEELYELRPDLPEWIIIKFRPRREITYNTSINDIMISPEDIYYKLFKDETKVGILLFIKNYDKDNKIYMQLAYLFLDGALGEYDMETKVGWIEFSDFNSEHFPNAFPSNTLAENFDLAYNEK